MISDCLAQFLQSPFLGSGLVQLMLHARTYVRIEDLLVSLSSANNEIHVAASAPGTSTVVRGNAGNDSLNAQNLASLVTFEGGAGNDSAVFVGTAGDDNFTNVGYTIKLGAGSLSTSAETREIDGQLGTNKLTLQGVAGKVEKFQLWPSTVSNAGRVNLAPFTAIAYTNVEGIDVKGNPADSDSLQVNGQTTNLFLGGVHDDRFAINLSAIGTLVNPVLALCNLQGQGLVKLINYRDVGSPRINGLFGADTFELTTSTSRPPVILDGGPGSDVLTAQNLVNNFVITGANAGYVGDAGFFVTFKSMENIVGSVGDDRVSFRTAGSLAVTFTQQGLSISKVAEAVKTFEAARKQRNARRIPLQNHCER